MHATLNQTVNHINDFLKESFPRLTKALNRYCKFNENFLVAIFGRIFYFPPKKAFMALMRNDKLQQVAPETNFLQLLRFNLIPNDFIIKFHSTAEEQIKKDIKSVIGLIKDFLTVHHQVSQIREESVPFIPHASILIENKMAHVVYPFRFAVLEQKALLPVSANYQANIDIYKNHFPEVDDLLKFAVASIFASSRKQSYVWLHTLSDWGKGFLTSIFIDLGIAIELSVEEVKQAFQGKAVGLTPDDFRDTFIVIFDEFSKTATQLKQLENTIPVSPKWGFRQLIPLFLKLLTSADSVPSLVTANGIEDQFANRLNCIEGKNQKLPVTPDNKAEFFNNCRHYIAQFILSELSQYKALEGIERTKTADIAVGEFYDRHKIERSYGRISDNLKAVAEEFVQFCIWGEKITQNTAIPNAPDATLINYAFEHEDILHIIRPATAFNQYLKLAVPQDEQQFLKGKNMAIFQLLQLEEDRANNIPFYKDRRINGKKVRCLRVNSEFTPTDHVAITTPTYRTSQR